MSSIMVSRLLRLEVEGRLADSFNGNLATACADCDISALAYVLNFAEADGDPQNFYRGDWTLDGLVAFKEPDLPALTLWVGEGNAYGPGQREMPRTFSGSVVVHWRFFLSIRGSRAAGLTDLREATESAMVSTLAEEFSGVTYRGDLAWQTLPPQTWLDRDDQAVGFVQEVEFQASFEVNV